MSKDTFVFTFRRHLLGELLARLGKMEKFDFDHALFGFQCRMTDPWPDKPVMAWWLVVYSDSTDKAPSLVDSMPIIRAMGEEERIGVLLYRYGLLNSLQVLWEQSNPDAVLLDLTVQVREDVEENTLEPASLEPSAII